MIARYEGRWREERGGVEGANNLLIYLGDFSLFVVFSKNFIIILCTGPNWGMMSLSLWVVCFFRIERVSSYLLENWARA